MHAYMIQTSGGYDEFHDEIGYTTLVEAQKHVAAAMEVIATGDTCLDDIRIVEVFDADPDNVAETFSVLPVDY